MAGKTTWLAIAGVLAVGIAGGVYWFSGRDASPGATASGAMGEASANIGARASGSAGVEGAAQGRNARPAPLSSAPLPPLDAPLATVVRELKPRAQAGDARALCRLAVEYRYCAELQGRMQMIESGVARAQERIEQGGQQGGEGGQGDRRGGWRSTERMASAFEQTSELYRHCEGVDVPKSSDIVRYMREAAVAGHPQAAGQYVSGELFTGSDMLDNLPELALYRDNAESMALAAVAQGDLRTAWKLAEAYASEPGDRRRTLLAQAVESQPARALSLLYALRTAVGDQATASATGNDPAQAIVARLQQRIASLERRLPSADVARARSEPAEIGVGAGPARADALQRLSGAMASRGRDDWSRDICD
ncbi:hypothetical protein [Lysobacter hankyongensis]|uniref:Sel1 repeat family protein n=1 Tax=Lysobacter hankyongensis TaxID=1176535 RepID=A0ABP9AM85_9GAMM